MKPSISLIFSLTVLFHTSSTFSSGRPLELKPEEAIKVGYSRLKVDIPMRDGVTLHTHIYSPTDSSQTYAIMMNRTPYSVGPYEEGSEKSQLGPSRRFEERGFIFVYQDVRGRFMSGGEFENMRPYQGDVNENTDTYDTIEWMLKNVPNHNGKVGLWGISYPGFYVSMGIINSHPAIAAASPQAPIADWFWDDVHHNGAFSLQLSFTFLYPFGQKRENLTTRWPYPFQFDNSNRYKFFLDLGPLTNANRKHFHHKIAFWNQIQEHPNYDSFWQNRNILPHLTGIKCAVLTVGGFFDAEDLYGALATYQYIEEQNPGIINQLVMGPWSHGAWARGNGDLLGDADFGSDTSKHYQSEIEYPFFLKHLYGEGSVDLAEATIFETGENRWHNFKQWPPEGRNTLKMYLHPNNQLGRLPETRSHLFSKFKSNPKKPVPYTTEKTARWGKKFMAEDQRFLDGRKDVLVFESEAMQEHVTVAGKIDANIWVSTSRTSADWVVKIIDVFPEHAAGQAPKDSGKQLMVRWEILRGRFRESFTDPKPFVPDQVTALNIHLQDVLHTFKKGHKVMVQIQSSFFPFFDRNPQTYVDNIFKASRRDFKKATHKVYTNRENPSHIEFQILP